MRMNVHRQAPWHRNWNHRPSTHRSSSWCFWAKLMLVHISYISVEVVRASGTGERIMMGGNEWRPPEAKHWSAFYSGHTVSTVTVVTSSLDRIAQSHHRTSASGPMDRRNGSPSGVGVTFDGANDARQSKASLAPSVTSFTRRIAPSLDTAGKHFLFRRDLSKTQDTHQTRPSASATFCRDPTSVVGNCSTANLHHREPTVMTKATSAGVTEDYIYASNRNYSSSVNGSAFLSMEGAELATLQSPLEDNHTAYYYTVVNLDNHNDVLCDDEYQLEYNENCFIDHNVTCVGDPDFCNLTYGEYRQLLMDYIYPSTGEWILIASHTVVFIMGLVGNALVCIAVYTNHTMRTVTNIFIVNLAVADFFVILFCLPPTVVWDVTETWFMGKAMCKVVIYFQTVSVTVSVLTLTFISIDRWYAICFPLRYKPRPERAWRSIALIWLIGFLSDLPEFLVLTTRRKKLRFDIKLFTQCVATWDNETEKTFYIVKFVLLYTLPLLFMTIAYFQIVRVLWRSDTIPGHRESRNQPCGTVHSTRTTLNCVGNTSTMGQLRARRKAAKMLVAVVIMFAGCYFPVHMLNVARYTVDIGQSDIVAVLSLFSHWLCYANSAVNPVIYNFMSGKFRREFKNALEKCRCLKSAHSYGGRVGGYDDRSLCHTATRLNVSPSTRSNYHLASVREARFKQQTQQTSFNGSRHQHGRSSMNHHNSLQPQISPVSMEERMGLTKSFDDETLHRTTRSNLSAGSGLKNIGLETGTSKITTNGSQSHTLHHPASQNLSGAQIHSDGSVKSKINGTVDLDAVSGSPTMLMIVNKSNSCKINGT